MSGSWKKYVLWFAQEHVDFRQAEITSLLRICNIQMKTCSPNHNPERPFWIVELQNDEAAQKLASRSMSLRCIFELWAHSALGLHAFHQQLRDHIAFNRALLEQHFQADKTFKVTVETYNKHFSQREKVEKIETMNYLPIEGQVDLRNPDVPFLYVEFWGMDPMDVPDQPYDVLFGRWIADGSRDMINEISLKKRKFIGNTSMDPQLSLLMANQALVQKGDLVLDPFAGSGSLLVAAAKFGAYVIGADIDYMIVHGKSKPTRVNQKVREKDESIYANLQQYGCGGQFVDVLIADFSRSIWTNNIVFDSIITDPPYGIREATERIEFKTKRKTTVMTEDAIHYPSTSPYQLCQMYRDLLQFSAQHLKLGGRLVAWFPTLKKDYSADLLPRHKCLVLVADSEQPLSGYSSRRLLTYEKVSDGENSLDAFEMPGALVENYRERYFTQLLEDNGTRKDRRLALREVGRREAMERGKEQQPDGKWRFPERKPDE
ncbi:tRNA (guanine(10)-N2)-methyltransferase homolog [Anopheles bellator]|uniref:tRNA (guanine(10)-N2)-methyltransferase homolog n=1 Tax=Anopheles bellator TaxID=139047 RepID=UPI002649B29F|nr:tRNA (guanine(10)-N2)-methyltransferase homolog [Anopheles bellator]